MQYITGIHALNLPCSLETCGDWHQSSIQWAHPQLRESSVSFFGEYGLEPNHRIPEHKETFTAANTIRALLDLLYECNFSTAQGMNNDFICNEKYDAEIFNKVYEMRDLQQWRRISSFMGREYKTKWLHFLEDKENG